MARTTVNVVDRGADASGARPINDVLAAAHGPDRELYFPSGRYRLNPITLSGSNWALRGEDATLVVPGHVGDGWLSARGTDWEIEGFTVDLRANGAAPTLSLDGADWSFRNAVFRGRPNDVGDGRPGEAAALLSPAVAEPDAIGVVENVDLADGGTAVGEPSNRPGIRSGAENSGHLILRGLRMAGWAGGTLDVAGSAGPVTVEDSTFRRTDVGVCVDGDAVVRNCVFVQDDGVPIQGWSGAAHGRGLWLNADRYRPGPILVENCDFTMTGGAAGDAIAGEYGVEHLTVRDCRFRLAGDRKAIDLAGDNSATVAGVDVTGWATPPAIQVEGVGTATDVCTPHGYDDVWGLSATDVQRSEDCLPPRTTVEQGPEEGFAHLRIATRADPSYEFVVDGTVRAGREADATDVVTRREDATTTVAGFVGYDDVDDYYVRGTVRDLRFIHRNPTVEADGRTLDLSEQPWELRPGEGAGAPTGDERPGSADREGVEPPTEAPESDANGTPGRLALPRYAGGGRYPGRGPVRGPGGEWNE